MPTSIFFRNVVTVEPSLYFSNLDVTGTGTPVTDEMLFTIVGRNEPGDPAWFFQPIAELARTRGTAAEGTIPVYRMPYSYTYDGSCIRGNILIPDASYQTSFGSWTAQVGPLAAGESLYLLAYAVSLTGANAAVDLTVYSSPDATFATSTVRGTFPHISAVGPALQQITGPLTDAYWRVDAAISGNGPTARFIVAIGVGRPAKTVRDERYTPLEKSAVLPPPAIPPGTPIPLTPANGATNQSTVAGLVWSASGATSYDVYFGTTNPPPLVSSGQAGASYSPGHLAVSTTYYWKITAINSYGSATGSVWSFTTAATEESESVTVLTTSSIGTQNDFNPGTLGTLNVLRCNNASLLTLNGLANGVDGQMIWIESVGAGQVDIANENVGSVAANRMHSNVSATISLAAGVGRALFTYDGATARWRCLAHEQGAWIAVPYNAGDFTLSSGTWTVDSTDLTLFRYWLKERTLFVDLKIASSSVGSAQFQLQVKIPGGFTGQAVATMPAGQATDNGGTAEGGVYATLDSSLTKIEYRRSNGSTWSVSTNATYLNATVAFEVQ